MRAITFNSESAWLLPYAPDSMVFEMDLSLQTSHQSSLTMREVRRAKGASFDRKLKFNALLSPTDLGQFRAAFANYANRLVLVPFWPCVRLHGETETGSHVGKLRIFWNGDLPTGDFSIDSSATPISAPPTPTLAGVTSSSNTAPVVVCKFDSLPTYGETTPQGWTRVKFSLVQWGSDSWDLVLRDTTLTLGASVNGASVPKLTQEVDWSNRSMEWTVRLERKKIGNLRGEVETFYTHAPRQVHDLGVLGIGAGVREVLALFQDRDASVKPLWVMSEHTYGTFIYGRFSDDVLKVRWRRPASGDQFEIAEFEFNFQTLPTEEALPSGETYGETIGPVGKVWWGFRVSNSANTWRYTSYSENITGPDGVYTAQPIEFDSIKEKSNLRYSDVSLTLQSGIANNPFLPLQTQFAGERLKVEILRGTASDPTAAELVFTGWAQSPTTSGRVMKVKVKPRLGFLASKLPRFQVQTSCAATFGDAQCGASKAGYSRNAAHSSGNVVTFVEADATGQPGQLAGGWIERTMPDGTKQRYMIASGGDVSGHLVLNLFGSVTPAVASTESWTIVRVCDRSFGSCLNPDNYRGFPYVPDSNPSMIAVTNTGGGKKG